MFRLQLLHVGFQFPCPAFQVTVVLGSGDVACLRTTYATLQTVFRHSLCIAVVIGNEFLTCQHVIGAQAHGVGFLSVLAFAIRSLLPCLSAFARHNRHDCGVDVRRVFVHVKHCRYGVLPSENAVQPLQVVGAPLVQPAFFLHSHQVFVRTRKHDADCSYLVGGNLASDACRAYAVAYRFGAVGHTVGELHQFSVEVGACGVGILGDGLAFDVVGCARVRRAFRLVDLDAYISHACSVF